MDLQNPVSPRTVGSSATHSQSSQTPSERRPTSPAHVHTPLRCRDDMGPSCPETEDPLTPIPFMGAIPPASQEEAPEKTRATHLFRVVQILVLGRAA
jgi:hypothetical protein